MQIHDPERLVKLLLEPNIDPTAHEEEKLRVERHKKKILKMQELLEEQKRAKEILDRVSAFGKH